MNVFKNCNNMGYIIVSQTIQKSNTSLPKFTIKIKRDKGHSPLSLHSAGDDALDDAFLGDGVEDDDGDDGEDEHCH